MQPSEEHNMMTEARKVWTIAATLSFTLTLAACGGDDGGSPPPPPSPAQIIVSGTVQAPAGQVALFTKPRLWERIGALVFPEAVAALSGVSPVLDGTPVQLVRIDDAGNVAAALASTAVSAGRYSFNLTSLGLNPSSNLLVQVVNSVTGAQMRAFVTGPTVDLDPISETAIRLVLERIALTPGTTLNQFTVTELRDIAGATNQLAVVKRLGAGLNIESTVSAIKTAVSSETGLTGFIVAASGPGETTEGPGDIGNYFPLTQGKTWQFQGTHSETGQPTVQFSNTMTVNGTKPVGAVITTILAESNPLNSGVAEEVYYLKDSRGILNYGNTDLGPLSPKLIPYREILFPLHLGVTSEVVNKKSLNYGQDLDSDGKNETADVLSEVTVEAFEDVTVPKGTFANAAIVVHKTTITVFSSAGLGSVKVVGIQTVWFAPGVGPIKRTVLLQQDSQFLESSEEELIDHYFKNFGPAQLYPSNGSNFGQAAIGDLNGDGRNDVALTANNPLGIPVAYQDAQGHLSPFISINVSSNLTSLHRIALGDLNNDGKVDLVASGACVSCGPGTQGRVVVYYQHPTNGTLLPGQLVPIATDFAASAAIGDINRDGRKDLVVVNLLGSLSIYHQLANGSLGPEVVYDKVHGDLTVEVHIADMDNDGDQDIVVQDFKTTQGQFSVIKQDSSVTPGALSNSPKTYQIPGAFRTFALGDLNGDGMIDVAVSDYANSNVVLFLQNSAGTLQAPVALPPSTGVGIEIADVNADGLNDLLSDTGNDLLVYLQAPDHSFKTPVPYRYQSQSFGGGGFYLHLAVGDITGDNRPDAAANHEGMGLFVLPNTIQ
jgi:FG-GAP-like repeat